MKLILGGYANGRTAYAMQNYQLTESDCFDAAAEPLARWNGQRLILHAEQLVNPWLEQGKEPCTEILPWLERWQNAVLITQEVGCGLVPVTPQQRQGSRGTFQQIVGRMCRNGGTCLLRSGHAAEIGAEPCGYC